MFESGPLIQKSMETLYTGIVLEPKKAQMTYRIVRANQSSDIESAQGVFEALARDGEGARVGDALFRSGSPGFIFHVYECDPAEAGHLIDQTVSLLDRKRFAEGYLQMRNGNAFLFADALTDEGTGESPRPLAEPLLGKDQRTNAEVLQIGEVQRETVAAYQTKWTNSNLTRLILANSEGTYAQMQLGNDMVRLIPSMSTVYAYETYADSCAHAAGASHDAPAANPKTSPKKKPGATP
jgi:hypothetical protein